MFYSDDNVIHMRFQISDSLKGEGTLKDIDFIDFIQVHFQDMQILFGGEKNTQGSKILQVKRDVVVFDQDGAPITEKENQLIIYGELDIFDLSDFDFIDYDRTEINAIPLINKYYSIIELQQIIDQQISYVLENDGIS